MRVVARAMARNGAGRSAPSSAAPVAAPDQIDRSLIDRLITTHIHATDRTKDLYVALIRAIFRMAMREIAMTRASCSLT